MLNSCQARWLLQLAPYDFTIHYRKGSLNLANSPLRRLDYLVEQEAIKQTTISNLMPLLINKLTTIATIRVGKQYQVKKRDPYVESLIRVLSLQATTRLEARLAIDNLRLFSKVELSEALIQEVEPSKALDDPKVEPNKALI